MIKLQDVNKYYFKNRDNEIHVINQTSLEFPDKGLVVLLGTSGSGKTTLLNVLGGLDSIDSGAVSFEQYTMNKRYSHTWDHIRSNYIGYIFQNYNLLKDRTVRRNIEIALKISGFREKEEIERRINYALSCMKMENYKHRIASELSGGQQQRVAIASALSKDPKVIIADEPTGNLDSKNTVDIMNIIKIISQSKLVILVTHDRNLAEYYADRIIKVEDGRIVSDEQNQSEGLLNIKHDQNIYLKDLESSSLSGNNLELDRFTDDPNFNKDEVKVKLIHRNETLYIKVDTQKFKKIKYIDDESEIRLVDAHEESSDAADEEITFDPTILKKEYRMIQKGPNISFSEAIKIASFKVKNISRSGKLMYVSFAMIGALLALCIGILTQIYTIDSTEFIKYPREYLLVETAGPRFEAIVDLEDHASIDDVSLITKNNNLIFELPSYYQTSNQYSLHAFISDIEVLDESNIELGRLPENQYEVVMDRLVVQRLIEEYKHIGINRIEDILNETIKINASIDFISFTIVGISNTDAPAVYGTEMLKYTQLPIYPFSLVEGFELIDGRLPEGSGELLTSDLVDEQATTVQIGSKMYGIVGKYDSSSGINSAYFSTDYFVKKYHYDELTSGYRRNAFLVYSNNIEETTRYLESLGFGVKDAYQEAFDTYRESKIDSYQGLLMFCAIGIGVSAISIFFITRSDLLSRLYEISVIRSLGATVLDISKVFSIEIFMITTISSFLGYTLMIVFLKSLQSEVSIIIEYVSLPYYVILLGIVLLYGINLIAGLIPVGLLLRRTPSEISKKYDL